ncbi:MAG: NAD(+) synthetase, partial [Planctomycetota bacterium]
PAAGAAAATAPATGPAAAWEAGPHRKEEEFTRAVALGLMDYVRKSHARGCVVSMSGGADSAAVAVLVATMVRLAAEERGVPAMLDRLGRAGQAAGGATTPAGVVGKLLACVYQATSNSSDTTRNAARVVSGAIGAEFLAWDVDALVNRYVETVAEAVGRPLTWGSDDVALQNVQARARGPGVWLLANLRDALLLSTSNRSEAAVGYATMDGDTCGGLSPIAGIDKAFLRHWLRWMETTGPAGLGPLPELSAVNQQQPTAELRPPSASQTDEADLMPYAVPDAIERCAVRDKRLPADTLEVVRGQFPEHDAGQVADWVDRFYRLWRQNQWKRERYAPSFHLDDGNLDPKSWCRFPILSAAYERELAELQAPRS